ncbi:hypothetical protein OQJ26_02150 [Legionella sp. PATHC038]|uniref:hypothetical protein n=1 Tax=Legionella sheltonii TaxID=2992041 RepID=UPI0022435045|nr:hypothetical protein [Legionella sp. PATHC038]MCW8397588.1 hypothetical protein [Legionella sp. PATHC038]
MKNSELLEIAREACTYAREHIKEGETTPRIKFYKKNADLLGKDFAETRRGYLKKKYPVLYEKLKASGDKEKTIIHSLQYIDRKKLEGAVQDMRDEADELWEAFCRDKKVEKYSERGQSIRRYAVELCSLERKIGNCGEFATLAFFYIQKKYPERLEEMNLTVLGVNGRSHVVVSMGSDDDRVICDPTLDLVFELKKEPEKLHAFTQSHGKNSYYVPEVHTLEKLATYNPKVKLNQNDIEELNRLYRRKIRQEIDSPSTPAEDIEENLSQEDVFNQICSKAINTTYLKPRQSDAPKLRLKYALQCYIKTRAEEAKIVSNSGDGVSYDKNNTHIDKIAGLVRFKSVVMWLKSQYTAEDKICTAQKVIDKLEGKIKDPITERELSILKDGRLGSDTKPFIDILEKMYVPQNQLQAKSS